MRYPSPKNDPRRDACPLCESPVAQVGVYPSAPEIIDDAPRDGARLVGVLDNVRSAQNVGTMFRSADGAAFEHLYLGGLTAPSHNRKVVKTALGANVTVPSTSAKDLLPTIDALRTDGFEIWAIDRTATSVAHVDIEVCPQRVALVLGNELAGVDPAILALADRHVHVPMRGSKTTLNVGVTFGLLAHWARALPVSGS